MASSSTERKSAKSSTTISPRLPPIERKVTNPKRLGIAGGSNGGLLVGVTFTRPELFNAVVCQVPLLDMLRYTKLLAGASWAENMVPCRPEMKGASIVFTISQPQSPRSIRVCFLCIDQGRSVHPHAKDGSSHEGHGTSNLLF